MSLRTIPRITLLASLRLARLPLDVVLAALPGNGDGPGARGGVALDRADATVRALAAQALGDPDLREDARLRMRAADERAKAIGLSREAGRTEARADEKAAEREREAQRTREQVAERARREREQAEKKAQQRRRSAERAAEGRRQASREAAARTQQAAEKRAERERLEALDDKAQALEKAKDAHTATDEAQRLGQAAARAKAARKAS